jgi:guanylate kinase
MTEKAIIISAPSGAGKTTIVRHLLSAIPDLDFSVSACSRPKREGEADGRDYHFISADEFRKKIENDEFAEWEEVYPGSYYGTLKSELQRIWEKGSFPIFDVDVVGGLNLKKYFGDKALAIFIQPPSLNELKNRLIGRNTENEESLQKRLIKTEHEMKFAGKFDQIVINNNLDLAYAQTMRLVTAFLD